MGLAELYKVEYQKIELAWGRHKLLAFSFVCSDFAQHTTICVLMNVTQICVVSASAGLQRPQGRNKAKLIAAVLHCTICRTRTISSHFYRSRNFQLTKPVSQKLLAAYQPEFKRELLLKRREIQGYLG